ncbi:MAG: hypothetical protein K6G52_08335 [Treponemataceae bacterium]|nr:hypothetical protein [Treponemataceae bacterium]
MAFAKKFYPKEEIVSKLTYREKEKLSSLVNGNLICIPLFFVFAAVLIPFNFAKVGIMMAVTSIAFVVSMVLTKKGHIYVGSYFATVGFLISTLIISLFVGYSDTGFVFFRGACFACVMANLNYQISIKRGQLILFMIASFVIVLLSAFTVYRSLIVRDPMVMAITLVVCFMGMFAANMMLLMAERQNSKIINHSENEHVKVEENLNRITRVLNQTKESINIGKELEKSTSIASGNIQKINDLYKNLLECADVLTAQTQNVRDSSEQVNEHAGLMSEAIQKQNSSLSQTSIAMTEISSNINNINVIAEKRREGMSEAAGMLDKQRELLQQLVNDIEKVKSSSMEIAKFVQTVDSIAGQTALLAMNASIEAAHAGTLGKGFSVIAQEIRKLSEETTRNANKISDALKENTIVVQATSESVSAFANASNSSTDEIKATVNSMEEIIHGISEINIATTEIMDSVQNVVDLSTETDHFVTDVVAKISEQDDSLVNISNTNDVLQERVNSIKTALGDISGAIDNIQNQALSNEEVSQKIAALLD